MRIIYNINKFNQEKLNQVISNDADIYIIPELACPSMVQLPNGFDIKWTGEYDFKGLGVIYKSDLNCQIPDWYNEEHKYNIPLIINDKLILAVWPTRTKSKTKDYPQIAMEIIEEYCQHLKEYQTVISGDWNLYKGQSGETSKYSLEIIAKYLNDMGYVSAYHNLKNENIGNESQMTYYHLFNPNKPFFLDYTFINMPLKHYQLGSWDKDMSDHVPQIIEI